MDYWKIQDAFHKRMKKDYESGVITNPVFKPYFLWKFYGASVNTLTRELCFQIMKKAQRELGELDIKHPNQDYGEDSNLYSYLIGIDKYILFEENSVLGQISVVHDPDCCK